MKTPVTIAYGDGIGPEIMESVLSILDAAKAPLTYETIEIGEKIYKKGITSGISEESWESIKRTGVLLKSHDKKSPWIIRKYQTLPLLSSICKKPRSRN
jgi:isocitrate/isopropylmalate dehydrogenase